MLFGLGKDKKESNGIDLMSIVGTLMEVLKPFASKNPDIRKGVHGIIDKYCTPQNMGKVFTGIHKGFYDLQKEHNAKFTVLWESTEDFSDIQVVVLMLKEGDTEHTINRRFLLSQVTANELKELANICIQKAETKKENEG